MKGGFILPTTLSPLRYPGGKTQLCDFVEHTIEINNISDLWFGRLTKICFCLIPFRNISKKCTAKVTGKMRDRVLK